MDSNGSTATWQDLRDGSNRIRFTTAQWSPLTAAGSDIVDDAAPGTQLYAPELAARGEAILIAWEDPRSGYARVRLSKGD